MSFAEAERRATRSAYSTAGIGVAVTYTPVSGAPVATTAIIEDEMILLGDSPVQARETRTVIRVLLAAVADPARGDRITETDSLKSWTVEHEERRDHLQTHLVVRP